VTSMKTIEETLEEIGQLKKELEQRDLLVQQLSEELFRLVKGNSAFIPSQEISEQHAESVKVLTNKLANIEDQLFVAHSQLMDRDREIIDLRQAVQELTDRTKMLEQVVQELPNVYRNKFAERMVPIKQKVEALQKENRQLHIELQSLSFRLSHRVRPQRLDLPKVQIGSPALPVFG
jgi:chromosome segregation ATPase